MEILQLLSTLSEDYPGLNEEIITSACQVICKVSVYDGLYCSMWEGYCSIGVTLSLHVLQEKKNILHQICYNDEVEMFRWLLEKVPHLKSREELNRKTRVRDIL